MVVVKHEAGLIWRLRGFIGPWLGVVPEGRHLCLLNWDSPSIMIFGHTVSPFNPYTINLEINEFLLKFSNKYSYQCNFIAVNNGPDHIQKENL